MQMSEFWKTRRMMPDGGSDAGGGEGGAVLEGAALAQAEETAKWAKSKGRDPGWSGNDTKAAATAGAEAETDTKTEAKTEAKPAEQKRLSFDELMQDEEYKKEHQARIDKAINKRFAQTKTEHAQLEKLGPILNMLSEKYHVDANDVDALAKAVEADDNWVAEAAMARGMDTDTYKAVSRLEAENKAMRQQQETMERERQAQAQYQHWMQQAEEAKQSFPDLDLRQEVQNPQFVDLLKAGVDVKAAYAAAHYDQIIPAVMQRTAQEVADKKDRALSAKASRPRENGAAATPSGHVARDPKTLKISDYEDIMRRAQRGETITL